ncbi:hypothetical protein TI39_contig1021g00019 [Zymoseptoria brevis]|uniref:Uncharacterized protein n=1 Tax=Zymoseptoria brevis TaxID=1047168 RepID=A0A0F4GEP8_9PEZI|nr:hypothetical protein TI39_contig1021g00019 [Zymoseptoria brevis]
MAYETLWLKKVLIPFWVLQSLVALIYLGLSSASLGLWQSRVNDTDYYYSSSYGSSRNYADAVDTAFSISAGILIGLTALTVLFNIIEMILFGMKKLSPVTMVVFNSLNMLIWTVLLILVIISAVSVRGTALGFVFVIVLCATSLGKLIYSSIMLHRHRRGRFAHRGEYTPAAHEAGSADTSYHPTSYGGPTPETSQSTQPGGAAHGYYSPASVGARG